MNNFDDVLLDRLKYKSDATTITKEMVAITFAIFGAVFVGVLLYRKLFKRKEHDQ